MNIERELLKQVYLAYMRFDKALHSENRNSKEIDIAYTWLDTTMSKIFDLIGEDFKLEQ